MKRLRHRYDEVALVLASRRTDHRQDEPRQARLSLTERSRRDPQARVTPQVIAYMQGTYTQAVAEFPKLANDPNLGCWYLGPDGHWYAGGPDGMHPDC
jgi:hypothetical protein